MWLARQKELMAVRDSSNGGALILNEPRNTHTHTHTHTHHNQGNEIWAGKDRYLCSSKGTYVGVYVECTRSFLDQRDTLSPAQL